MLRNPDEHAEHILSRHVLILSGRAKAVIAKPSDVILGERRCMVTECGDSTRE